MKSTLSLLLSPMTRITIPDVQKVKTKAEQEVLPPALTQTRSPSPGNAGALIAALPTPGALQVGAGGRRCCQGSPRLASITRHGRIPPKGPEAQRPPPRPQAGLSAGRGASLGCGAGPCGYRGLLSDPSAIPPPRGCRPRAALPRCRVRLTAAGCCTPASMLWLCHQVVSAWLL